MSDTIAFLKKRFSDYYREVNLYLPDRFGKREWGFMFLGESFMKRHLAFQNVEGLRQFLVQKIPAHVYHSTAYYEKPDASTMQEKNWLGADLIFDLDADHIKHAERMTFEKTLDKVKEEFIKLIDNFLLDDFGFEEKQLTIVFSGGRGYHIHIRDPGVLQLSSHERREIVDYITGKGLDMEAIFPKEAFDSQKFGPHVTVKYKTKMPEEGTGGWKKKMREGIMDFTYQLENLGEEESKRWLASFEGVGEKTANGIYTDLFYGEKGKRGVDRMRDEQILEIFSDNKYLNAFLDIVKGEKSVKMEGEKREIREEFAEILPVKEEQKGETDEPVTSDIRRLIRLPSSLHGKTGFRVMPLSRKELDDFDPFRDAVPEIFSDEPVPLEIIKPYKGTLRDETFDLKKGQQEIPEFAAVFLLCRRFAEIIHST